MRLIDADDLKNELTQHYAHLSDKCSRTSIESDRMMYINTATGVLHALNKLNNAQTVDVDELIAELTDQIIDLTDFLDSKNIFVWIDEDGTIHECRSKEEREAEYKLAWLKYITGEVKTNENND